MSIPTTDLQIVWRRPELPDVYDSRTYGKYNAFHVAPFDRDYRRDRQEERLVKMRKVKREERLNRRYEKVVEVGESAVAAVAQPAIVAPAAAPAAAAEPRLEEEKQIIAAAAAPKAPSVQELLNQHAQKPQPLGQPAAAAAGAGAGRDPQQLITKIAEQRLLLRKINPANRDALLVELQDIERRYQEQTAAAANPSEAYLKGLEAQLTQEMRQHTLRVMQSDPDFNRILETSAQKTRRQFKGLVGAAHQAMAAQLQLQTKEIVENPYGD